MQKIHANYETTRKPENMGEGEFPEDEIASYYCIKFGRPVLILCDF